VVSDLEDLLAIDQQARVRAADWVRRLGAR
jgi:hypothetical protein